MMFAHHRGASSPGSPQTAAGMGGWTEPPPPRDCGRLAAALTDSTGSDVHTFGEKSAYCARSVRPSNADGHRQEGTSPRRPLFPIAWRLSGDVSVSVHMVMVAQRTQSQKSAPDLACLYTVSSALGCPGGLCAQRLLQN